MVCGGRKSSVSQTSAGGMTASLRQKKFSSIYWIPQQFLSETATLVMYMILAVNQNWNYVQKLEAMTERKAKPTDFLA